MYFITVILKTDFNYGSFWKGQEVQPVRHRWGEKHPGNIQVTKETWAVAVERRTKPFKQPQRSAGVRRELPCWTFMYEQILIIWGSCILSARLLGLAVSQRAAFSVNGASILEEHGVFCRGLKRDRPRWISPRLATWRTGVTRLICTTQPRASKGGPNSICKCGTKTHLDEVKCTVTGTATSPPVPDITGSAV